VGTQVSKLPPKAATNGSAEDRTAEICFTAARVIYEKGYDAASMNDIAAAANLTKAGLYYYTTGKQDLLYRIIDIAMSMVEQNVIQACIDIADPEARLEQIIRNHIATVTDGAGAVTILTDEVNCLPSEQRTEIIERKRQYLEFVRQTLRELNDKGRLRDLDPDIAALNLFSTILGFPRWYHQDGQLSPSEITEQIMRFTLGALLKE